MAVRPLVNIERLTTAHVNSVDGSMTYESGVEYKANTTVSYNGSLYTANVDIEDTDTDTPDAAPEKWSLTINASDAGTSGDISALAARVTALEDIVDDLGTAAVHDITNDIVSGSEDVLTSNGSYAALAKKLSFTSLSDSTVQLFDVLSDDTTYPGGSVYVGYALNFKVGTDNLETLLSLSQYANVEIYKYSTYVQNIKILSPGGGCAFAYSSPVDNNIVFGIFKPTGNGSVTINKPV